MYYDILYRLYMYISSWSFVILKNITLKLNFDLNFLFVFYIKYILISIFHLFTNVGIDNPWNVKERGFLSLYHVIDSDFPKETLFIFHIYVHNKHFLLCSYTSFLSIVIRKNFTIKLNFNLVSLFVFTLFIILISTFPSSTNVGTDNPWIVKDRDFFSLRHIIDSDFPKETLFIFYIYVSNS